MNLVRDHVPWRINLVRERSVEGDADRFAAMAPTTPALRWQERPCFPT